MVGYAPSSFADLVFADERIEVGLKRGKFGHPALIKTGANEEDEKLLILFSQERLTRAAVTWYTNLEPSRVHSWKDLMVAFVRQCQHNSDMALDRMQL